MVDGRWSRHGEPGNPVPEPIFPLSADQEVADELQFHIEMRTRELVAGGMAVDAARRMARERFHDLVRVAAECQTHAQHREDAVRRSQYFANLSQDIRFAFRMLRQRLGFALMAVLPLALGIGAATAMYSVVDGVMLRPLPFPHPERLTAIWAVEGKWKAQSANPIAWDHVVIGQGEYIALRDRARAFTKISAWARGSGMVGSAQGTFESVNTVRVTSSIFDVLGIRPILGRAFLPGEDVLGGPHIALIGWELWQHHFNGDSNTIGRSVVVDGDAYTVVGIMPPRLRLDRTIPPAGVWTPAFQDKQDRPEQHNRSYRGLGRLAPGATLAQANAEVASIMTAEKVSWKGSADGTSGVATNWQDDQVGSVRASLLLLAGAVSLLLLIACVNVATLMFGEAARRQPEIAARTALGATPGRLARQLLTESLVIAGCGAVLGLGLGWALTKSLVALAPGKIPGLADVRFDGRVFLFTAVCAVVTGIAFGVLPTFALLRWGRHSAARGGGGQTARGENRIQRVLVAAEVALSLIMLVGCSLLGRSLVRLSNVDPGFVPNGLIEVQLTPPPHFWTDSAAVVAYYDQAVRQLASLPGVAAATAATGGLFNGGGSSSPLRIVGAPATADGMQTQQRVVRANYFHTVRVPIIAGRDFTEADNSSSQRVVIVSANAASRDFPGQAAVGRGVIWQGKEWTIIGVAANIHYSQLSSDAVPTIYVPDAQNSGEWMTLMVRGNGDGTALFRGIRERLAAINPAVTIAAIDPVPTLISHSYAEEKYRALLGSLFGLIGAVLAAVGMFGVISRTVARRMREAGIRVALGSPIATLTRLMLRETAIGAAIGLLVGLPAAALLARSLKPYLFGVNATDPVAFIVAIALLTVASICATLPPARRVGRIDPVTVLRGE